MTKKKVTYIPIIRDGAIGTIKIGDGKIIPVLILDCSNHQEFLNLVHVHKHTEAGDVESTWGRPLLNSQYAQLKLKFSKPAEVEIVIRFDLRKQSAIADSIVQAKAVYLQPSIYCERVIDGLEHPKILIEIPPSTKLPKWDKLLLEQITKKLRSEGLKRKEAKNAAKQHLARMRELLSTRAR